MVNQSLNQNVTLGVLDDGGKDVRNGLMRGVIYDTGIPVKYFDF